MKYILGLFFIIGVPLACALLLQTSRSSAHPKRVAGLAFIILGCFVVCITCISYVPMIIMSFADERISKIDEVFGLFVWLIPGISMILTGIMLKKPLRNQHSP
jgi:hypothetical protein